MAGFLLIHGSCHSAWCWHLTIAALVELGHQARAIDLPSHGDDPTPAGEVTLDLYAQAIVAALRPGDVLVGHSMAGYPITAAAELAPEKIARLVYLCAYVPMPGRSLADMRRLAPRQPLMPAIRSAADGITFGIDPGQAREVFYHDVPPVLAAEATARLGAQPVLPQETPLHPDRSLAVPRSYIRCRGDRAVPPEFQATMTEGWPEGCVVELPSSHSPFLSMPKRLAATLAEIAGG